MRVLIAEDEPRLAEALARGLRRNGFAVDIALDGNQALRRTAVVDYDVVVLDRDLPAVHGDEVCRQLVGGERPPRILMLTAAADVRARVEGLNLGADDYLTNPSPSPKAWPACTPPSAAMRSPRNPCSSAPAAASVP